MEEFYLFLSSDDSKEYFPDNAPSMFTVKLPQTLELKEGNWFCILLELSCKLKTPADLYVFCDGVQDSYVRDRKLPVLQHLPKTKDNLVKERFGPTVALPVSRHVFNTLTVYIKGADMVAPSFMNQPLTCTLRLFKK